jgi:cytoskeletal protein CcmA (bactofilin family)
MWGRRDEPQAPSKPSTESTPPAPAPVSHRPEPPVQPVASPKPAAPSSPEGRQEARVGKSLSIKGDISGNENLYVDGEVHGKIDLKGHHVTIGPNGKVHADVTARGITILGHLQGNLRAEEKVDIRQTGTVEGDLITVGISIEEGAVFRGSIDIVKPGHAAVSAEPKPAPQEVKPAPPEVKPAPLDMKPQPAESKPAQAQATTPVQTERKPNQPDFKPGKPGPASQGNIKRDAATASKSM